MLTVVKDLIKKINKKKSILVTGGAGYIGSNLSNKFLENRFNVFVIDDLSTGNKKLVSPKVNFYKLDFAEIKKIKNIIRKNNIKNIFHLAAKADATDSKKNPKEYLENNFYKIKKFLRMCNNLKIENFFFASSAAVYGDCKKLPINENYITKPLNPYGESKLLAENFIKKYCLRNKIKFIIFRFFNVSGADVKLRSGSINSKTSGLIKKICEQILRKRKKITIFGDNYNTKDGTCVRDYIHVSDVVDLIYKSFEKRKKLKNLIFNCCTGKGYTVKDVVNITEKISGDKVKKIISKINRGEIPSSIGNNALIKKKLGSYKFKNLKKIIFTSLKWEKKIINYL